MKVRPLHDRILVERLKRRRPNGAGSIIPTRPRKSPRKARSIVGNGKVNDDGKKVPLDVKAGRQDPVREVLGLEVKIDDKEFLIMREEDSLAILSKGDVIHAGKQLS